MLMTNENVRLFPHDKFMAKIVLSFIPLWLVPNYFTVLRIVLVPVVLFFMLQESWMIAFPLFLFAAFTDVIDGSLARTRKQITMWGTVADPVADKLLIGSVALLFVADQIHPYFALLIVGMELCVIGRAVFAQRKGRRYVSANVYGKVKMFLQVVGVCLLLTAKVIGIAWAVPAAIVIFGIALLFAVASILTYGL